MKKLSPSYLLQTITLCSIRILFVDPKYFCCQNTLNMLQYMKDSRDSKFDFGKCLLFVEFRTITLIFKNLRLSLWIFPNLNELSRL
jgi:hypothetical protein